MNFTLKSLLMLWCLPAVSALWSGVSTQELAVQAVMDFNAGNFEAIRLRSSEPVRKQLTAELLTAARKNITSAYGEFVRIATVRQTAANAAGKAFALLTEFQRGRQIFTIVFDKNDQLVSFLVSPQKTAPQPENNEFFSEHEISFGASQPLPGFLAVPRNTAAYPVVILVHGSGPLDRDETVLANTVFRDIAHGLARQGIGVLRYDKRTFVYQDEVATVNEEVINDVAEAIEFLKSRDCHEIYVLGHSLGGMLIPRIALRTESVAGYILMAPAARPLEDIILEQSTYLLSLDKNLPEAQKQKYLASLKHEIGRVKSLTTEDSRPILNLPASYWLDLKNYSPPDSARRITVPTLILQGERDYQVTMVDLGLFRDKLSSNPNFGFKSYPDLNHLFIGGSGQSTPQEYGIKGKVADEVIRDIGEFIRQTAKNRRAEKS